MRERRSDGITRDHRRARAYCGNPWILAVCLTLLAGYAASMAQAQTPRLLEINSLYGESDGSDPADFCTIGGLSYFVADDGTYGGHGRELWVTDGTAEGTRMVADINSGTGSSDPQNLTSIDGTLYFSADDGTNGQELWVYDGSSLAQIDLNPSSASNPAYFCSFGGAVYFAAEGNATQGRELWKYNGTTAALAADIKTSGGSDPTELVVMNGALYFAAENDTDGRQVLRHELDDSTVLVKNVSYMAGFTTDTAELSAYPAELTVVGNLLYYTAEYLNGEFVQSGMFGDVSLKRRELFVTDGTEGGTARISDIGEWESELPAGSMLFDDSDANVRELTVMDGTVYFVAHEPTYLVNFAEMYGGWTEVWKTDGSLAGSERVTQVGWSDSMSPACGNSADVCNLTVMGDHLYFSATDGVLVTNDAHNQELWRTDGVALGNEELVKDINTYLTGSGSSGSPYKNQAGDPKYLCAANTSEGERLFFQANSGPDGSEDRTGVELWMSDGTSTGTVLVCDLVVGSNSVPENMTALGATVVFSAETQGNEYGRELHVSDGTDTGTHIIADIAPGPSHSGGAHLTTVGDTLYLSANDAVHGREVWRTRGTTETTELVAEVMPGYSLRMSPVIEPYDLTALGDTLYFFQRDGGRRPNLYKTDGTAAGTERVHDFFPEGSPDDPQTPSYIADPSGLTAFNGALYFSAYDYNLAGLELWTSDGTDAGTFMLKDIFDKFYHTVYGDYASKPANFTVVGDWLFFSALAESTGLDLWKTDGTEEGTVIVKNVDVDANTLWGAEPFGDCIAAGDRLFYVVNTYALGKELWVSDGSDAGTTVTKDIRAGAADASPDCLVALDGRVFFQANDGTSGVELWSSDGTQTGTVLVRDIRSGSGSSGPEEMLAHNGRVYFSANDGTSGAELWVSDGTYTGTTLLRDIHPSGSSSPEELVSIPHSDYFVFTAETPDLGREIWISDGTASGTTRLFDLAPGATGSDPDELTVCGTLLYFTASDGTVAGNELWAADMSGLMRFFVNLTTDGSAGAVLDGATSQTVSYGADSTAVWAVAPNAHSFVRWTRDGEAFSTANPLILENVTEDFTLQAVFGGPWRASVQNWEMYE